MCGIVAIHSTVSSRDLTNRRLNNALSIMHSRGPDDSGTETRIDKTNGGLAAVGMCRLRVRSSTSDLVPFAGQDGEAHALNGEVYAEFRSERGMRVVGGTAEAALLQSQGGRADGMWALATLDRGGVLGLRRDCWGIKPLWIRSYGDVNAPVGMDFIAASDVRVLLEDGPLPDIRKEAVAQFLLCGRVVDQGSLWHSIRQLPRGSSSVMSTVVTEPEKGLKPVWDAARLALAAGPRKSEVGELIRGAVRSSVAAAFDTDRVTGLAVSGGLDSTILALHARELGISSLRTVSIRVQDSDDGVRDLSDVPDLQLSDLDWTHHVRTVTPEDYLPLLRDAVRLLGQPTGLTSVPLYLALGQATREAGVSVLLVGEGADELWGGYRSYLNLHDDISPSDFYVSEGRRRDVSDLIGPVLSSKALSSLVASLPVQPGPEAVLHAERDMSLGPLLERTDLLMMANSVEARTPFLHGLGWAIAQQLPIRSKVGSGQTKRALREAYREELPSFMNESKKPFRAPWDRWLTESLGTQVAAVVDNAAGALEGLGISTTVAQAIVYRGTQGDAHAARIAFSLCSLSFWLEDQNSRQRPRQESRL